VDEPLGDRTACELFAEGRFHPEVLNAPTRFATSRVRSTAGSSSPSESVIAIGYGARDRAAGKTAKTVCHQAIRSG